MRVVLSAWGSRGDVQPLIALGAGLAKAGHEAVLVAPPDFASEAAAFGVSFRPMGRSIRDQLTQHADKIGANPLRMMRAVRSDLERDMADHFTAMREACRGADAVLGAGILWAAASVAEAFEIPYWYVAYAPEAIRSQHHAPVLLPFQGLPRFANRVCWKAFGALTEWLVLEPINRERARLDLPPIDAAIPRTFAPTRALLATDPELATWPADVSGAPSVSGWMALSDPRELGAAVERFLDAGPPPVYFGFGSMVHTHPERTTRMIVEVARAVGRRAVISAGWAGLGADSLGTDVLVIGSVPHAKLFPRVAAVVHHGGAGTAHAAARAGVPQIIVPHLLDQFAWARRLALLGLTPKPLVRWRLTAGRLASRVTTCLEDTAFQRRASALGVRLRDQDGVRSITRWLEQHSADPSRRSPSSLSHVATSRLTA